MHSDGGQLQLQLALAFAPLKQGADALGKHLLGSGRRQLGRRSTRKQGSSAGVAPFASISMCASDAHSKLPSRRRDSGSHGVTLVAATTNKQASKKEAKPAAKAGKQVAAASVKEVTPPATTAFSWPFLLANMAAGATAGAAVETALYPIDTIKTRLQAVRGGGAIVWKGLYKGLAGNICGVIPASAIFMGVYEPVKRAVTERGGSPLAAQFAAATLAGTAASLVRVPTEVVKQRMQMGQFSSAVTAVRTILLKEGLRKGLYAGYGSFMLRDLPFDAIEFIAYEQLKTAMRAAVHGRELNGLEVSAIGAGAGVATAVLTTPLDVIKTRLMTQGAQGTYKGIFDCCRQLVRDEGAKALFKGVGPRVTWIGIGGSVFFTCLEASKKVYLPLGNGAK